PTPPPQVPEAPPPVAEVPPPPPPAVDDNPNQSNVQISPDIQKACGISDAEAFFAYDSANVREPDRAILRKLATCFTTGPLAGKSVRRVGHAAPRGDEEYNRVLGQRRADNVKGAIVSAGMDGNRIATTSRGEDEATGTDDASWARDRRVEILLGN